MSTEIFPTYASKCTRDIFSKETFLLMFSAGVIGEIAVEFFAWVIVPQFLGRPMEPSVLVQNLATAQLGIQLPMMVAFFIHFLAGAYFFVLGYVYFCDATKIRNIWIVSLIWGLILWVIAQGFFAPLAGRPFFLGFGKYTWWSVGLHTIAYSIPTGFALEYFGRRRAYQEDYDADKADSATTA